MIAKSICPPRIITKVSELSNKEAPFAIVTGCLLAFIRSILISSEEEINMDLMNASKQPVTMANGASLFDSSDSFVMNRGGHIDLAIMGALQIDQFGEIANWAIPGKDILGVGGAMDLVAGANRIIIASMHQAKDGTPKLVDKLSFPSS